MHCFQYADCAHTVDVPWACCWTVNKMMTAKGTSHGRDNPQTSLSICHTKLSYHLAYPLHWRCAADPTSTAIMFCQKLTKHCVSSQDSILAYLSDCAYTVNVPWACSWTVNKIPMTCRWILKALYVLTRRLFCEAAFQALGSCVPCVSHAEPAKMNKTQRSDFGRVCEV